MATIGKATPIHNAALHPPVAYAHPPIADPMAPPKKKIAIKSPFRRLRISGLSEKSARCPSTRFADTPASNNMAETTRIAIPVDEPVRIISGNNIEITTVASAIPVTGFVQPRSANRPARGAAIAPATPTSANNAMVSGKNERSGLIRVTELLSKIS